MDETSLAPCTGGFEYKGLTMILSCESTLAFSSGEAQTNETAPARSPYRPMFCNKSASVLKVCKQGTRESRQDNATFLYTSDICNGRKYLGERLTEQDLVSLLDKVSDGIGVFEDITRCEALVRLIVSFCTVASPSPSSFVPYNPSRLRSAPASIDTALLVACRLQAAPDEMTGETYHVKEREVLLLLDNLGQLAPLRFGGVDTGGVLPVS